MLRFSANLSMLFGEYDFLARFEKAAQCGFRGVEFMGNDSNLLIVFYVQIMPDDFVMQLHRF